MTTPGTGTQVGDPRRILLLGRDDNLDDLTALVDDASVRLVTITGPGGVGKTRVAEALVARLRARSPDGAVLVELAALTRADAIAAAVADSLGLVVAAGDDSLAHLVGVLNRRRLVLVLDNLEHLLDATPMVTALADACPGLTVVVTSRAALNVRGEHRYPLGPLGLPPVGADGAAEVLCSAAGQLYCKRARAVRWGFQLDDANAAAVAATCRWLEGLPLAIELAAAQLTVLSPVALHDRLVDAEATRDGRSLDVLGRGLADLPERQQSLRHTLEASYGLLGSDARALFPRLAVFEDGFTLAAVDAVAAGGTDAIEALSALVDLNLVDPVPAGEDGSRFRLLSFVRAYADGLLDGSGQWQEVMALATDHLVSVATEAERHLDGPGEGRFLALLDHERHNLAMVLDRLLVGGDTDRGLALAVALSPYWLIRNRPAEAAAAVEAFLVARPSPGTDLDVLAAMWRARFRVEFGAGLDASTRTNTEAEALIADIAAGVEVAVSGDDATTALRTWAALAQAYVRSPDPQRAVAAISAGLELARTEGSAWWEADFLRELAWCALHRDDHPVALDAARGALSSARRSGNMRASLHASLTAIHLSEAVGGDIGDVGDLDVADIGELVETARGVGFGRGAAWLGVTAGLGEGLGGDLAGAARRFRTALIDAESANHFQGTAFAVAGLAGTATVAGDLHAAARLFGALEPHLVMLRSAMPTHYFALYQEAATTTRRDLGDIDHRRAVASSAGWSWAEARAAAIETADRLAPVRPEPAPAPAAPSPPGVPASLTPRELEVVAALANGDTNKDIARSLGLSAKTVMHHTTSIYRKLAVRGRAEAATYALRHHLIDRPR